MTAAPSPDPAADTDVDIPGDGRDETETERLDRNWNEILQELRVIQTGTQILTGFLLAIAFQQRFTDLDAFQIDVYLVLVSASVLATLLGLAPVSLHRELFRRRAKRSLVHAANILLRITLAAVALVLIGTVLLVFDVVATRPLAITMAAIVAVLICAIWLALPWRIRTRTRSS
ncbi:sodium:proton antiporter [Microbacteriaceae bacterium VKM Ac-2855]|nr:sodium:proton antiporter [Microbacteriaceae bacterium VKM Ac-2855]